MGKSVQYGPAMIFPYVLKDFVPSNQLLFSFLLLIDIFCLTKDIFIFTMTVLSDHHRVCIIMIIVIVIIITYFIDRVSKAFMSIKLSDQVCLAVVVNKRHCLPLVS